jgi:hypothetical protein
MSGHNKESPLIPESLLQFYRRMAREWQAPTHPEAVAIAELCRVVEVHHSVAASLRTAVEFSEPGEQEALRALCCEQTRLAEALGEFVSDLGGSPPEPDQGSPEIPRDSRAMSFAHDQTELMGFVRENLDWVAIAHSALASVLEIPSAMRQRLQAQSASAGEAHQRAE